MAKVIDLTGLKFGKLTVIEQSKNKNGKIFWRCLCDCGNFIEVQGNNLKSSNSKSCGKCNRAEDLTGMRFGKLVVVRKDVPIKTKNGSAGASFCQCDCGNYTIVRNNSLKNGRTKSCGCGCAENRKKILKKPSVNTYKLFEDYGVGTIQNSDKCFYFDIEDYDKIKEYNWSLSHSYLVCHKYLNNSYIYLHKMLLNADKKSIVDHKDGNPLNCRKENLRFATNQQNAINRSIMKSNASGTPGVSWKKDKQKWKAYITLDGKQIHLGYFDSYEDAVESRKKGEQEYFGEWVRFCE